MVRILAVLLLAGISSFVLAQAQTPSPILPDSVRWQGTPGAEIAWFIGAADKAGIYAQRVKLQKGGMIAPHTHPDERFSVVLAGTIYVGFGDTVDESRLVAIPEGAMYIAPAGVAHYVMAKDGDAVYQESGVGPTATAFLGRE